MSAEPGTIHASALGLGRHGLLILGRSGAGKSALALEFLLADPAARLIGDDRVRLIERGDEIVASPPARLAGLIEVRGVGILAVPHLAEATITHVVEFVDPAEIERLPADGVWRSGALTRPRLCLPAGSPAIAFAMTRAWLRFLRVE